MLSKCANPGCSASFHSLGEGRLFQLSSDDPRLQCRTASSGEEKKPPRSVEYFWLCSNCSKSLTIHMDQNRRIYTAPRTTEISDSVLRSSVG